MAKGAALYALMKKVKVSLPEQDGGDGEGELASAQEVADQLGISREQVETMAARRVATVVPRAFGIKVVDQSDPVYKTDPTRAGSRVSHLLTANTSLPADTGPQVFCTLVDNQHAVKLEVWEQAGSVASEELGHNTHIGEGMLTELPPRPAGAPFDVEFHMTETGLLQVHGHEAESGREVRFEIQIGGLDETEVQQATDAVARYEVSG